MYLSWLYHLRFGYVTCCFAITCCFAVSLAALAKPLHLWVLSLQEKSGLQGWQVDSSLASPLQVLRDFPDALSQPLFPSNFPNVSKEQHQHLNNSIEHFEPGLGASQLIIGFYEIWSHVGLCPCLWPWKPKWLAKHLFFWCVCISNYMHYKNWHKIQKSSGENKWYISYNFPFHTAGVGGWKI